MSFFLCRVVWIMLYPRANLWWLGGRAQQRGCHGQHFILPNSYAETLPHKVTVLGGVVWGRHLGLDEVTRVKPHSWDECPYENHGTACFPSPLSPCQDRMGSRQSAAQKRALTMDANHAGTLVSGSQPPELWGTGLCWLLGPQSVPLCGSSQERVIHGGAKMQACLPPWRGASWRVQLPRPSFPLACF